MGGGIGREAVLGWAVLRGAVLVGGGATVCVFPSGSLMIRISC